MANDDKKFDLKLGTTADTSGLEKTERALKDVEEAAKDASEATNPMSMPDAGPERVDAIEKEAVARKEVATVQKDQALSLEEIAAAADKEQAAQREADVERAKQLQSLREIEAATKRIVAIQIASELNKIAQQYRGINQETDAFLDGLNAMAAGIVSGNPYVALGTAAVASINMITAAFKEAEAAEKANRQSVIDGAKQVQDALQARSLERSQNAYVAYFNDALAEARKLTAELQSQARILAEIRKTETSDRELQQSSALRAGADPNAVARDDFRGDFQEALTAIADTVKAANDRLAAAEEHAGELDSQLTSMENSQKFTDDQLSKQRADLNAAREAAESAKLAADEAVAIAAEDTKQLFNSFTQRFQETNQEVLNQAGEKAGEILKIVEAEGKELTFSQEKARERIKQALSDGTVTAKEFESLSSDARTLMTGFSGSLDTQRQLNKLYAEVAGKFGQDLQLLFREMQSIKQAQENFRLQLEERSLPGGN